MFLGSWHQYFLPMLRNMDFCFTINWIHWTLWLKLIRCLWWINLKLVCWPPGNIMICGKVFVLSLKMCFEISHVNRASYGHEDGQANCGSPGYNFFSLYFTASKLSSRLFCPWWIRSPQFLALASAVFSQIHKCFFFACLVFMPCFLA